MKTHLSQGPTLHFILRIASAMCFIGHGAFGIITKPIWCNYFAVCGIDHDLAYKLMPVLGTVDILLGLSILIYPIRAVAGWLIAWGMITALLRPLSGEPFAEFFERAGNFGAPLALILLSAGSSGKGLFARIVVPPAITDDKTLNRVTLCLKIVVFLLIAGHGWLNLLEKKGLLAQYQSLGFSNPARTAQLVGIFEVLSACSLLVRPFRLFILVILLWKMGSELFYPHYELFEWVERGGSYGSLLALWVITARQRHSMAGEVSLAAA